ncbi:MAG: NADH-quinone oxidoreductase subunit C [Bacillota bacterium]
MEDILIGKDDLLVTAQRLVDEGARLATATCLDEKDKFQVIYHFQKEHDIINVRLKVDKDEEIPSISEITLTAALIENEMREFFGLNIVGLVIDFKNRMILSENSPETPLCKS